MRNEKEWYTCNRCGAEIENGQRGMLLKKVYRITGFFAKDGKLYSVVDVDLCPKCRKDFERFMKNG